MYMRDCMHTLVGKRPPFDELKRAVDSGLGNVRY